MATLSTVVSGSQLRSKTISSSALDSFTGQRVVGAIPTRGSWRRGVVVAIRAGPSDSVEADNGRFCGFCLFYELFPNLDTLITYYVYPSLLFL